MDGRNEKKEHPLKTFECKKKQIKPTANKYLTVCPPALQVSDILEDLGCYLNSQGTGNIYHTIKNVEVNLFEDIELRITMNISNIISCFWFFKKSKACKLSFDSENR